MVALAQQLEQYVSLVIFLASLALVALSGVAWRRERSRRMLVVAAAYAMFAVYGLVVFLEQVLLPYLATATVDLLEHGVSIFVLAGILTIFVALTQE